MSAQSCLTLCCSMHVWLSEMGKTCPLLDAVLEHVAGSSLVPTVVLLSFCLLP